MTTTRESERELGFSIRGTRRGRRQAWKRLRHYLERTSEYAYLQHCLWINLKQAVLSGRRGGKPFYGRIGR